MPFLRKTNTMTKTIVLLLLITYACKEHKREQVKAFYTDTEKLNLKGRIKSRTGYVVKDSVKTISFNDNFNEIGFLIERHIYNFYGNVWINETYDYKNNTLNKITSHFPNDSILKIRHYLYKGNTTEIHQFENTIPTISEIEKFDDNKNKIYSALITEQDTLSSFFKYDAANNLISEKVYSNNQKLVQDINHTFNSDNLETKTEQNYSNYYGENTNYTISYLYDSANNKTEVKTYKNGVLDTEEKRNYINKNSAEHLIFNKSRPTKVVKYTYDNSGNIISEIHKDLTTNQIDTTEYHIEYYD